MEPRRIWTPSPETVAEAALTRFAAQAGRPDATYDELWEWSTRDLPAFWRAIWRFFDVQADGSPERVLASRAMPFAEWFPDVRLAYVDHVFRNRDPEQVAVAHASELRGTETTTWGELADTTGRIATGLRAAGVGPGDRVAAYLPNVVETVAAFLATAAIGAVWSSAAPEFGLGSVVDRFAQIEPVVLLAADGYRYGGKDFDRRQTISELQAALPSVRETFVLPYLGSDGSWDALVREAGPIDPVRVPFAHPLWILYSSGTTGLPKPIVHGQGGILLEHLKKLGLHLDLKQDDRLFWFTTTGWMMWNLLVGGLLTEAQIVLYDGNPATPTLDRLWDLAEEVGVTCFGTSAAFISASMKAGVQPRAGRSLERLRSVGSTGSPLSPEGFRWVEQELGDVWLFSTSGGTDVCTAFVGGVPTLPVYEGELQARSLGARVEAFDEGGASVVGEVGELVLTEPLPSMPLFLWGDDADGTRYRETYFDRWDGVWRHGDWIEITERGTAVIYGRSDATINRGGVRIGTSEIYRAVLDLPEVLDAIVVDVPREGTDGTIRLFVVPREGVELSAGLVDAIRRAIRERCSPRHVPDEIQAIAAVPRTLSGKALEIPIKRILMGTPAATAVSRESLANPEALEFFEGLAQQTNKR